MPLLGMPQHSPKDDGFSLSDQLWPSPSLSTVVEGGCAEWYPVLSAPVGDDAREYHGHSGTSTKVQSPPGRDPDTSAQNWQQAAQWFVERGEGVPPEPDEQLPAQASGGSTTAHTNKISTAQEHIPEQVKQHGMACRRGKWKQRQVTRLEKLSIGERFFPRVRQQFVGVHLEEHAGDLSI